MKVARSVGRLAGAQVIDLSERTVSLGFIDTHVHLTMDAAKWSQPAFLPASTIRRSCVVSRVQRTVAPCAAVIWS
jgi:predicted amidohydrolase YtcJ